MAGAHVGLELDNGPAKDAIRQALAELAQPQRLLRDIGEHQVNSTRDNFRYERSPSGQPWPALSPRYLAVKEPNPGKILQRSGNLARQIQYQVQGNDLFWGTDRIYGATHQFGARRGQFGQTRRGGPIPWGDIAAREFLGVSDADADEIIELVRDHLRRQFS
ncbi:phage virion morphogenesis protein [Halopseudomonas phragmitis]|uniref:Phage virion morphogenesis protein n=1 Tax=Halopseudomonas phragmitis TaxID=1931241 RepID=A0A1V0B6J7_9GAMM|nr:phage virion morphogenesis protein [Halopseudomonas phragmitis]AQZ95556.1 phage virion morphogenesis protein [Halopseudomonas phragmitis]PAU86326.1 phage virion morphogenesis protein [Pseudomonas sp. WN033]